MSIDDLRVKETELKEKLKALEIKWEGYENETDESKKTDDWRKNRDVCADDKKYCYERLIIVERQIDELIHAPPPIDRQVQHRQREIPGISIALSLHPPENSTKQIWYYIGYFLSVFVIIIPEIQVFIAEWYIKQILVVVGIVAVYVSAVFFKFAEEV